MLKTQREKKEKMEKITVPSFFDEEGIQYWIWLLVIGVSTVMSEGWQGLYKQFLRREGWASVNIKSGGELTRKVRCVSSPVSEV